MEDESLPNSSHFPPPDNACGNFPQTSGPRSDPRKRLNDQLTVGDAKRMATSHNFNAYPSLQTIAFALVVFVVAATISTSFAASACAPQCSCVQNIMSCVGKGLTALPSGHWPSVMFLDVSSNAIANIDDLGRRFPSLNALRMRHNALSALPLAALAGPSAPNRLMLADLTGNRIAHVLPPPPGARLGQFSALLLSSNRIAALHPDTFAALPNLRQLALADNPLALPAAQPFLSHPLLNELDLSGVDAFALSEHTFAELPSLVVVSLERSGVHDVNGVFKNLQSLETLYLQSNAITEITSEIVQPDTKLNILSLEHNPLIRVDTTALLIQEGGELAIDDTPLACACAHAEVARWAADHRVKLSASCHGVSNCQFD